MALGLAGHCWIKLDCTYFIGLLVALHFGPLALVLLVVFAVSVTNGLCVCLYVMFLSTEPMVCTIQDSLCPSLPKYFSHRPIIQADGGEYLYTLKPY